MSGFSGESGWTVYLEESGLRREEEGDLSMVSDASSGAPNGYGVGLTGIRAGQSTVISESKERQNQRSYLDDTATSPVFGFSKKEMNSYIEGYVKSAQDLSQSNNSRKRHAKKPTVLFQPTSAKRSARKVPGNFQDPKWE